jgi:hypothetical protein
MIGHDVLVRVETQKMIAAGEEHDECRLAHILDLLR